MLCEATSWAHGGDLARVNIQQQLAAGQGGGNAILLCCPSNVGD